MKKSLKTNKGSKFSIVLDVLDILNDKDISKLDKTILCTMLFKISYSFIKNNWGDEFDN